MYMVCVVDQGEVRTAGRATDSLVQGECLLGVESSGGQRNLVARLDGGKSIEEAVKFVVEENGRKTLVFVDLCGW